MPRLTLRTLLAYIDDTLEPDQARSLGRKVAQSDEAKHLIERIKKVTRRRGLRSPVPDGSDDDVADPNTVAAYLSDNLDSEQLKQIESTCLESDVHLAEVAACHQILTLVMTEPVRVPPTANQRMYNLVPPPAADLQRKPGKAIPVGGVTPPASDEHDSDDTDAALLLGLRRYAASDSWAGRLKLVGAVGGISLFLVLAILMALPSAPPEPLKTSHETSYALAPPPTPIVTPPTPTGPTTPTPTGPTTPTPTPTDPMPPILPMPPEGGPKVEPDPKVAPIPKVEPGPGLGDKKVSAPLPGRGVIGKMERPKVIVLTREPEAGSRWLRVDPKDPNVSSTNVVMALPGYKADVKLTSGVVVQLWGNVPEQLSMKAMVMQSRVRFYTAPTDFDADFTLEAGRVYLSTTKPAGSKIRVRIASEAWDIDLPNDNARVMVQAHTAFVPGTPYPNGGIGGEPPRTEALMVVVRGTANFEALARFAKFPTIPVWNEIVWNSKTNNLVPPAPVNKQEVIPDPDTLIPGDIGVAIQQILSDAADHLSEREGIRTLLEERMGLEKLEKFDLTRMLATYAYAAITDGAEGEEAKIMVAHLYDILVDSDRVPVRRSAVMAVSAWIARSPQHTPLFVNVLNVDKLLPVEDANLIAQLLRGYSAAIVGPTAGDTSKLVDLVKFLNSDLIVVREAALGNLIAYYDLPAAMAGAVKGPPPITNVGTKGPGYDLFLRDWEARSEDIKKWMVTRKTDKK